MILSTNQVMERRKSLIQAMAKGKTLIMMRESEFRKIATGSSKVIYLGVEISNHPSGIGIALTDPNMVHSNDIFDSFFVDPLSYYCPDLGEAGRIAVIRHRHT